MKKLTPFLIAFLFALPLVTAVVDLLVTPTAQAHSGSPALTTWSNGQTLTSAALNDAFAHLHNTLTGAIANVNMAATAAIAHTKLATPALVPKAWADVNPTCACSDAADVTACAISASSGVTEVKSSGTAGICRVRLSYTPQNANFAVQVVSHVNDIHCVSKTFATAYPHVIIECRTITGAPAAANSSFSLTVMDNN